MKFGSIFLLALFFLQEGYSFQKESLEERIEEIKQKRGYELQRDKYRGIAEGQWLYWKANVDGVAYETTSVAVPANGGNVSTRFKTRSPHFNYDPGFRLALGFQSAYDLFDVCLIWTRFYTKGHDKAKGSFTPVSATPEERTLSLGIGLIQPLSSIPNKASAECRIQENILDLQLGRGIPISRHFFMRPFFGVRAVWSDIHWDISLNRNFLVPLFSPQDSSRQKIKNDFQAAGGLIGLNLEWKMPYGLGISLRGAGALVYGLTEEKTKQIYTFLPSGTTTVLKQDFHAQNSYHSVKGLLELFIGIIWDSYTKMEKEKRRSAYLRLYTGYEFQQWPFVAQKTNTQIDRQRELFSLSFQGFTSGVKVVF